MQLGADAASATITITIEGANDDPTGMAGTGSVMAGAGDVAMGNAGGADVDSGDTLSYAVGTAPAHGTLEVDEATGAWTYMVDETNAAVRALGAGETAMDKGTIVISDGNGGSATVDVDITISGIVDMPEVTVTTNTVKEDDSTGPNLAEVTSPDTGVTFSVDHDGFEIVLVGSAHVLKVKEGVALDHEGTDGSVTLMVTATDGAGNMSDATSVTVMVSDVNEMPMITAMSGAVDENAAGATVGAVMVSDPDAADMGLSAVSEDDRFEVVGGMLKLKDGMSLDHEAADSVMVTVTVTDTGTNGGDEGPLSDSVTVMVTVNDVNEAPTVTVSDAMAPDGSMARAVISENAMGAIGQIKGMDVDDDMLTYSVDDDRFMVEVDDMGDYWLKLVEGVNFEEEQSVTVKVTVSDGMLMGSTDVTVKVTDANEAPTIKVVDQAPVDEDMANQFVGTIVVGDVDAEDSLGAGNVSIDDPRFQPIANADGSISLVLVRKIDADADGEQITSVPVTLTVTDTANGVLNAPTLSTSITIDVMITGDNEKPTISIGNGVTQDGMAANGMVNENVGDAPVARIDASDPEDGPLNHGSLMIVDAEGKEVMDGPFMIVMDPEDGVSWLKLAEAQDFETDGGMHTVTVRVTDAGGEYADHAVTVTINDVNEAPTTNPDPTLPAPTVMAGDDTPAMGSINAMDQDGDDLTFDNDAMYGTLEVAPDGSWTYTLDQMDPAVRALDDGETMTDAITITVSDGEFETMATIDIMITGINDAPMITVENGGGDVEENAKGAMVAKVTIDDPDKSDTDISGSIKLSDNRFEVVESVDGEGFVLRLKDDVHLDHEHVDGPTVEVTILVTDSTGVPGTAVATVNVENINEPPTILFDDELPSIDENETGFVGTFQISDPEDVADISELDIEDVEVVTEGFEVIESGVSGKYELRLKEGYEKDHEKTPSVKVTLLIKDTDEDIPAEPIIVDVAINDIDEQPTLMLEGLTASVDENVNMEEDFDLGSIMASDEEDGALMPRIDPMSDDADRFVVKMDEDDGTYHLYLKGGMDMVANHETDGELSITLIVEDSGEENGPVTEKFTLKIDDLNEAPEGTVEKLEDRTLVAGQPVMWEIDLTELFEDEDVGDNNLRYSVNVDPGLMFDEDETIALTLTEQRTTTDGVEKIIGTISSGDQTIWSRIKPGSFDVNVVATDDEGLSDEVPITVHVDDRNDRITSIRLYNLENDEGEEVENFSYEIEVSEDQNEEVNFGRVVVEDLDDNPLHPHGRHTVTLDAASMAKGFDIKEDDDGGLWLVLNAGQADNLDYESDMGHIFDLTITAEDGGGSKNTRMVTVVLGDVNEKPVGIEKAGNWWVTVDEDLDAEDVTEGQWLSFKLDDSAFNDEDAADTDATLMYEIIDGPSWLKVLQGGMIVNQAMMMPDSDGGREMVTIQATDSGGLKDTISFYLTWAVSGAENEDNDDPTLKISSKKDVEENPGAGVPVATVTVNDDDAALIGHPFAPGDVTITSVVNADDPSDSSYMGAFTIEQVGDSNTWTIMTTGAAKGLLDHETVDDITITVTVSDGADGTDTEEIDIDVTDMPEKPEYQLTIKSVDGIDQSESEPTLVWINLYDAWEDRDDNDDDNELDFGFVSDPNSPWIKLIQGSAKWEDVMEGPDGDSGTADDLTTWGTHPSYSGANNVFIGSNPGENDKVMLVLIDRTGTNNKQADVAGGGSFTITATDESGKKEMQVISVPVADENEAIGAGAVSINGATREGSYLTARFDETKDPDLADGAEAYLVVYTFTAVDSDGGELSRQVGTSDRYKLTQQDVGMKIKVSVMYRELFDGEFVDPQPGGDATTPNTVRNAPDPAEFEVNLLTDASGLVAEVTIIDEDGEPASGRSGAPMYTWEESVNGFSGWDPVADQNSANEHLIIADGGGKYYRLVVTYTDLQGRDETYTSEIIQVGELTASSPTITGSAVVGGTLRVDGASGATVVWQRQVDPNSIPSDGDEYWDDIPGSTGNTLTIGNDHSGEVLRAVVTTSDANGITGVQAVLVNSGSAITGPANTEPNKVKDHDIDARPDLEMDVVTTVREEVPLADLFDDLDGDTLTFTAGPGNGNAPEDTFGSGDTMYVGGNDAGLISFDVTSGSLVYLTDEKSGHDGDPSDGGGNVVTFEVMAHDGNGGSAVANVNIHLNVRPTEIEGDSSVSVQENAQLAEDLITDLNVQDENSPMHEFGQYTWTVSDNDRFEVVPNGEDSSKAVLKVLADQEFETNGEDGTFTLTITATEEVSGYVLKHTVTVTVFNDPSDDDEDDDSGTSSNGDSDDVPGLEDDDDDTDDDGGTAPTIALFDDGLF